MLSLANSDDNPSETPLSHLEGRTILTKTDAVDQVEGLQGKTYKSDARQHCQTMQHARITVHREEYNNYWFKGRSPTTAVYYGLQACRQFTDRCHRSVDRNLGFTLRIFGRDAACGNRVTEDQEDPRLTGKTHVLNSTYNFDQKSSIQLTMTIRNRHTPTTFNYP